MFIEVTLSIAAEALLQGVTVWNDDDPFFACGFDLGSPKTTSVERAQSALREFLRDFGGTGFYLRED